MHPYTQDIEPTAKPGGGFTDGDPILGVARTVLKSVWPNMIEQEILNVLAHEHANDTQDGPLAPSLTDTGQLVQAIANIAAHAASAAAEAAATTRRPIGLVECGPYETIPENALALAGGVYNRNLYPALWNWITAHYAPVADAVRAEFPGRFTSGDGVSTFRMPDMEGLFVRALGGGSAALGRLQPAALMAHTHVLAVPRDEDGTAFDSSWAYPQRFSTSVGDSGDSGRQGPQQTSTPKSVAKAGATATPADVNIDDDGHPVNVAWRWIVWAK